MTKQSDEQAAHISPTASSDLDDEALTEQLLTKQAAEHQLVCSNFAQHMFITYQFHRSVLNGVEPKTDHLPVIV